MGISISANLFNDLVKVGSTKSGAADLAKKSAKEKEPLQKDSMLFPCN
jgi:hypothetical protein